MLETNMSSKGTKNLMSENATVYFPWMQESRVSNLESGII